MVVCLSIAKMRHYLRWPSTENVYEIWMDAILLEMILIDGINGGLINKPLTSGVRYRVAGL